MPNVSPNQVLYLRALLQRRVIRLLIVASAGRAGAACDGRGFTWANIAEIASQDDSYWSGKTAKIRIQNDTELDTKLNNQFFKSIFMFNRINYLNTCANDMKLHEKMYKHIHICLNIL